jgi:Tol biopolymer transport system component
MPTATGDRCREITRDGRRQVIWRHATKQLVVRDLAANADRPLTTSSGEEYFGTLSPDDRVEVFVSNREGQWAIYAAPIDRAPVARPIRLSDFDPSLLSGFGVNNWTPDGFVSRLLFNDSNILRVNVDQKTGKAVGQEERLTQDSSMNHTPAVSPDGKQIVYWSRHGTRFGLAVMDANGTNERLLLEGVEDVRGLRPSWRSTSEVLFTVPAQGAPMPDWSVLPSPLAVRHLRSANTTSGSVVPVTDVTGMPGVGAQPQYLASTAEIFHLSPQFNAIHSRSIVDGRSRVVATFDGDNEVASFLVSPDGRRLAYVLAQRYSNGLACFNRDAASSVAAVDEMVRPCEVRLLDLATGEKSLLTTRPGQGAAVPSLVAWSPGGRFLIFGGGRPQILDTSNGEVTPLLPHEVPLNWDWTGSWSPDGTFIVLTSRSQRTEWRQWKGVR